MSFNHVVVWIDHAQAHLIHFNPEASESEMINLHSTHNAVHVASDKEGPAAQQYLEQVASALAGAGEILVVGPGVEKLVLMKYLSKHQPALADHVVSVETVDHPTDGQLLAYARKYFVHADRLL